MTTTLLIEVGVIPATLVVLLGMGLLGSRPRETADKRFLLFLIVAAWLLSTVVFLGDHFVSNAESRFPAMISYILTPAILGVLVLILLNLRVLAGLPRSVSVVALLALAGVVYVSITQASGMGYLLLAGGVTTALAWLSGAKSGRWALVLGGAALVVLALTNILQNTDTASGPYALLPPWLARSFAFVMYGIPGLAVSLPAVLVVSGLRLLPSRVTAGADAPRMTASRAPVILRFGLAALLLGYLAYTIVWLCIWDHTSDGLGGLAYVLPASIAAIAGGMIMALLLADRRALAGLAFAVAVPLLLNAAFEWGWQLSYQALTDGRAARIQAAVERFHDRNGRYPALLAELVPADLLWVPQPVVLRGQGWCYQGGPDYYRLGAFYREFFGTPLSLRTYTAAGTPPPSWACGEQLAALKARYDPPPFAEHGSTANPAATPLPPSTVSIPKTPVQPLVTAAGALALGKWSVDGRYLLFGQFAAEGKESVMSLYFLDAATGRICPASLERRGESGPREHAAWLPDGRLLFVPGVDDMSLVKPCASGAEVLSGRYPIHFDQVAAVAQDGSRVLLKASDAYWILDGRTLEARQIPGVSPNPYELHWDRYAWSPDAARLAISRLDGRDASAGSTLYVVSGATGEVLLTMPQEQASAQSAPMVDWLAGKLLTHGTGGPVLLDVDVTPPRRLPVMQELFGLDVDVPDQIWAIGWFTDPGGRDFHVAVRVNHPRNQATYLYHSHLGQAEAIDTTAPILMFFPGGEWAEMSKAEPNAPAQDVYELVWVDRPTKPVPQLTVEGHLPRDYTRLAVSPLPGSTQVAFTSSQGVSLVSLPDGKLQRFWELAGPRSTPYTLVAPGGEALVVVADASLYYIPQEKPRTE